ncbi:hypothetical protein PCA31118_05093 [Pandoraea captiosa]|uniref:Uncharacterized protein n=1 Tax=Pandoraea captiosa TaxID=2508302 RepID=A0A5E5ARJ1_9BURK|nr:hypothetical protein [Pandoraea captiosa]VVE75918.1 hypothetical protein PCA31118_05093 [Pandoraea captiosa]
MTHPIESNNSHEPNPQQPRGSRTARWIWAIVCVVVAFFAASVYLPHQAHAFVLKFLSLWIAGSMLGHVGVRLGDGVQRIIQPDILVTSARISDVMWTRICWAIGPQIVGLYVGAVVGTSILADWIV